MEGDSCGDDEDYDPENPGFDSSIYQRSAATTAAAAGRVGFGGALRGGVGATARDEGATAVTRALEGRTATTLDLSRKHLTTLPCEIGALRRLRTLNVHTNHLQTLPATIGELEKLESLDVSNNQLRALPPEIGKLQCLRTLDVSKNPLKILPCEVLTMAGLQLRSDSESLVHALAEVLGSNTAITSFDLTVKVGHSSLKYHEPEVSVSGETALSTAMHAAGLGFWFKEQQRILAFALCSHKTRLDLRHNRLQSLPAAVLKVRNRLKNLLVRNRGENQY